MCNKSVYLLFKMRIKCRNSSIYHLKAFWACSFLGNLKKLSIWRLVTTNDLLVMGIRIYTRKGDSCHKLLKHVQKLFRWPLGPLGLLFMVVISNMSAAFLFYFSTTGLGFILMATCNCTKWPWQKRKTIPNINNDWHNGKHFQFAGNEKTTDRAKGIYMYCWNHRTTTLNTV